MRTSNIIAGIILGTCVLVTCVSCAALGWREVTVRIAGAEAGATDGGGE